MFTEDDVHSADVIRVGQALGLSLREIVELRTARRSGDLPRKKRIALMKNQLARLEAKSAELERLKTYVRAKLGSRAVKRVMSRCYGALRARWNGSHLRSTAALKMVRKGHRKQRDVARPGMTC
jgi:DNA-binding transcriptional MerR regulator